jgi:antitoxin FitA
MPSIQIKNVPPEVHATFRRRADESHQSLQEYLLTRLVEEAARPTMAEVMARIEANATGVLSFADAAQIIRAERDSH